MIGLLMRGAFTEFSTVLDNEDGEFQYCVNEVDFDHVSIFDHLLVARQQVLALRLMGQGAFWDRDVYNAFPSMILAVKYHCNSILFEMIKRKREIGKEALIEFLNTCGPAHYSALAYAIAYKNLDAFRLLLNSGATVDEKALALAAVNGEEEMLRMMLRAIAGTPAKVPMISYALGEVESRINLFTYPEHLKKIAAILTSAREY